jgi:hypothetical protein
MKTLWLMLAALVACVVGVFIWHQASTALGPGDQMVTISAADGVEGDLVRAGRAMNVLAEVEGDVALAGSELRVSERVHGYLMAAGGTIELDGVIDDDAWVAGRAIHARASIGENASFTGRDIVVGERASIGRDARFFGSNVSVRGPIGRDLSIVAGDASLASEVKGTVEVTAQRFSLLPGAVVHGDLVIDSAQSPQISEQATVMGNLEVASNDAWMERATLQGWLSRFAFILIGIVLLGAAATAVSGTWPEHVARTITARPARSALFGTLGIVLTPVACALLVMTVFGVPLAIALFALYVVSLLLAAVFVSYLLGTWVLARLYRSPPSPYGRLAAGALIIALLASVPRFGWIVQLAVLILGVGAVLVERRYAYLQGWNRQAAS